MRSSHGLPLAATIALIVVGYFKLPDPVVPIGLPLWSLACTAAVLWRAARLRRHLEWFLIGLALLCSAVGELLWTGYRVSGTDPFPSYADLFYLLAYPLLGGGFVVHVRRSVPGGDWASIIDASIVAVAASALAWVLVGAPYVQAGGSLVEVGVALAYPLGDLPVLGFLCRLLLAPGLGSWSVRLLTIGTAAMLAADSGFLVLNLSGGYREGHVIDAGWLLWYGLTAAAAWHSSAASHGEEASQVVDLPPARLALLAVAAVMPPAVLILEGVRQDSFDVLGVGVITAVLLLLVMARMAGLVRQVRTQTAALARLSDTDQLTGVPNRRAWDRQLTSSVARAQRAGFPLAVALVDMDHFKRVNDTRGHAAGDRLLAAAAAAWAATLRAGDLLARYGGEEFAVLLPGADGEAAFRAAERIRLACPDCESCSVGIAVMTQGDSAEDLLRRADAALYQAKRSGRNRTVLAQPPSSLLGQD